MKVSSEISNKGININVDQCLPQQLVVNSAGNHLYLIGLSHFRSGLLNRSKIYNPLLITVLNFIFIFHSILSLSLSKENPEVFIWIVDPSYFINARIHFNVGVIILLAFALISQYLHYKDYKSNKTPNYLKPFQIIEG